MIWHVEHVGIDTENDIRLVVHPIYVGQGEWVWHWAIIDVIDEDCEGPIAVSVVPGFKSETEAKQACDDAYRLQWLPYYQRTGDRDWPPQADYSSLIASDQQ